jgi:hypothetical protein
MGSLVKERPETAAVDVGGKSVISRGSKYQGGPVVNPCYKNVINRWVNGNDQNIVSQAKNKQKIANTTSYNPYIDS